MLTKIREILLNSSLETVLCVAILASMAAGVCVNCCVPDTPTTYNYFFKYDLYLKNTQTKVGTGCYIHRVSEINNKVIKEVAEIISSAQPKENELYVDFPIAPVKL